MNNPNPIVEAAITKRKSSPIWKAAHQCPHGSNAELKVKRHRTAPWTQLYLEESYFTKSDKLVSRQTGICLSNSETRRLIDAICPGLLKHAIVAAEVIRSGRAVDEADREVLRNLELALAELHAADRPADLKKEDA